MLSVPAFVLPERPTSADLAVWLDWEEEYGDPGAADVVRGLLHLEPFDLDRPSPGAMYCYMDREGACWHRQEWELATVRENWGLTSSPEFADCRLPNRLWDRCAGYLEERPPRHWKTYRTPRGAWLALLAAAREKVTP